MAINKKIIWCTIVTNSRSNAILSVYKCEREKRVDREIYYYFEIIIVQLSSRNLDAP